MQSETQSDTVIDLLLKQSEILKNELDIKNKEIEQLREDNKRLSEQLIVLSDKVGTTLQSITQTQLADKIIEGKKLIEETNALKEKKTKKWWEFW